MGVHGHRWRRVLRRPKHVETRVPEVVATLADKCGWETLMFAAMIGAYYFVGEAAEKWEDRYSNVQEEDYWAFVGLDYKLCELRESLPVLPRVVEEWFRERG